MSPDIAKYALGQICPQLRTTEKKGKKRGNYWEWGRGAQRWDMGLLRLCDFWPIWRGAPWRSVWLELRW